MWYRSGVFSSSHHQALQWLRKSPVQAWIILHITTITLGGDTSAGPLPKKFGGPPGKGVGRTPVECQARPPSLGGNRGEEGLWLSPWGWASASPSPTVCVSPYFLLLMSSIHPQDWYIALWAVSSKGKEKLACIQQESSSLEAPSKGSPPGILPLFY